MKIEYNKLVRDRIPEIIDRSGNQYEIATYSESEYLEVLRQKLVEEAQEAADASPDELVKELADLYEVIDALMLVLGIDRQTILSMQQQRRDDRGGFSQKIKLLWTMANE
jgi:predicted house-cleaning noncanonical NTP pyrophosphatase (MazG superfamily)